MSIVEDRVQIAIDNWAPRFIANGIDSNDLQQLTRTVQRWEDWSPTWNAMAALHEKQAVDAESQRNFESAGEHYFAASMLQGFRVTGFTAALIGSLIYSLCGMVIDVAK